MTSPSRDFTEFLRALQDLRIGFEIVTERIAKASGLNPRDLSVLDVLHADGPATPKMIADKTGITPTTLAAVLTRLERDGKVNRSRNPEDARSSLLAITEQSVAELARRYAELNDNLRNTFAALSASERTAITGFLHDLAATTHGTLTAGRTLGSSTNHAGGLADSSPIGTG